MKIYPVNLNNNFGIRKKYKNTEQKVLQQMQADTFTHNATRKPDFDKNTFIIRMQYYGQESSWAEKMNNLASQISVMVEQNKDFDEILKETERGIVNINGGVFGTRKQAMNNYFLKPHGKGSFEYYDKYRSLIRKGDKHCKIKPKSNDEHKSAKVCSIYRAEACIGKRHDDKYPIIRIHYGWDGKNPGHNLTLAKKEYERLKSIKNPTPDDINKANATIHWLIVQEAPYARGNESIANILTKAIYNAYNIKVSAIKPGKSWDFEAFCRNLDSYIQIYPTLFEEAPEKIINTQK